MAIRNDNLAAAASAAPSAHPLFKYGISLFRLGVDLVVCLSVDIALVGFLDTTLSAAVNIVAVKLINVDAPVVVSDDQVGCIFIHVKEAHWRKIEINGANVGVLIGLEIGQGVIDCSKFKLVSDVGVGFGKHQVVF